MISRRSLLFAAPALLAAPAIVRAASLMAVRVPPVEYLHKSYGISIISQLEHESAYVTALMRAMIETKEMVAASVFNSPQYA